MRTVKVKEEGSQVWGPDKLEFGFWLCYLESGPVIYLSELHFWPTPIYMVEIINKRA